jgi:hypothetical protein
MSYVTDDLVGLALLNMESLADAQAFINADPVVQTGAFDYQLYVWVGQRSGGRNCAAFPCCRAAWP